VRKTYEEVLERASILKNNEWEINNEK
jgi:hypothetical protein